MNTTLLRIVLSGCLLAVSCRGAEEKAQAEAPPVEPKPQHAPKSIQMTTFQCTWADEEHEVAEIGFNLPDAAFALALTEEERAKYRSLQNEDDLVIGDAHFVRGYVPLRIRGTDQRWGLGLWVKLSKADFDEFTNLRPAKHPTYQGTIANQDFFGAPTLGSRVEVEFREPDNGVQQRPVLRFAAGHPLAGFEADGLPKDVWRAWNSEFVHHRDPEPADEPVRGALKRDGWMIHALEDVGKEPYPFEAKPKVGDDVKAVFGVLVSDEKGESKQINAGWWITLDDVDRDDRWTGTLSNGTRVPATIRRGSRIWVNPGQILDHASAEEE